MVERKRLVPRLSIVCGGGLTKQSFKAQCDVNTIVEKARLSGLVSHVNMKSPVYADVSSVPDYQSAFSIIQVARSTFNALSSKVRERFSNDPSKMISFLSDKSNYDEAVKLGLFIKKDSVKDPDVCPPKAGDPAPKA